MVRFPSKTLCICFLMAGGIALSQAPAQTPAQAPAGGARGGAPTRDPNAAGYVKAKELADGSVPSAKEDGNFIIGPTHTRAPEMAVKEGVPQGQVFEFTMES